MSLLEKLQADVKTAMLAKDEVTRDTLRMLIAAVKKHELEGGKQITDELTMATLQSAAKTRQESIDQFTQAGRKDLVAYALLNNSPHEDTIGRSQKVGKEEIIGMVKALEIYLNEDHDALAKEWQDRLGGISQELMKVPGVSTAFFTPDIANHVPHMQITWDSRISLSAEQVSKLLRGSKPAIVLSPAEDRPGLVMNSFMLQPGEDKIVAEQLARILRGQTA